jgi:5-(carboxyamino)imidazole ribonucleotide mutase
MTVAVIMGSDSDLPTMQAAIELLAELGVEHEVAVVSAHRDPTGMVAYAEQAADRGIEVIIAGAGGAAHLPGMVASCTHLPVIGVDSLLSIVQMPTGIPVATTAIGDSANAALLAARILALGDPTLRDALIQRRHALRARVEASNAKLRTRLEAP